MKKSTIITNTIVTVLFTGFGLMLYVFDKTIPAIMFLAVATVLITITAAMFLKRRK